MRDPRPPRRKRLIGGPLRALVRLARLMRRSGGRVARRETLSPRRLSRALSRRSRRLALDRLRRLPCFRADEYVALHPDVRHDGIDPYLHALLIAGHEERRLFRADTLARCLGAPLSLPPPCVAARARVNVGLYVSSLGNLFMREMAEDIAAGLRAAGANAELLDENAPPAARPPLSVFVAPHEFFLLGRGAAWLRDEVIAGAVMLNTEQPQTKWFGRALPLLLASRGVIDLCPQAASLFAAAGMPALHLAPAPNLASGALTEGDRMHPLFRVLPAAARAPADAATPFAARPIDVCFFGSESPRREKWLAQNAGLLAGLETVIHYRRETRGPIRPGAPDAALTRIAQHVGGHAKIVLNLHRDAFGYLEWHRVARLGIATGAVVVSERCLPYPLLTPGVHYLQANGRRLPGLLSWLLRSDDGRRAAARIQGAARALLAETITPAATGARLLGFLAANAGRT